MSHRVRVGLLAFVVFSLTPPGANAQVLDAVEVTAFGGYRFGGDFYEIVSGRPVDVDGAMSFGVILNVPFHAGTQIEAMVTHQEARFTLPSPVNGTATRWHVAVDHYQVGGLSEYGIGRVRPFMTGTLGLTRYAAADDTELRFSLSAGGGVKLFPTPRVGLRLDGRIFATVVDADADALICTAGGCIGSIHAWVVWQADFTAGAVVRF